MGFLYPCNGAESDYQLVARRMRPSVEARVVSIPVEDDSHREDALRAVGSRERLLKGATHLQFDGLAAAMWACTSGSFVFGLAGAREQAAAVEDFLGVPVSSTSLAFLAALAELNLSRVAIAATYPRAITALFRRFLADGGIDVVHAGSLGIMAGSDVSKLEKFDVLQLARANDHELAEAILIPDTALNTVAHIQWLESDAGKPVLTSNLVTAWQGLRLAGHPARAEGLGTLFGGSIARVPNKTGNRSLLSPTAPTDKRSAGEFHEEHES